MAGARVVDKLALVQNRHSPKGVVGAIRFRDGELEFDAERQRRGPPVSMSSENARAGKFRSDVRFIRVDFVTEQSDMCERHVVV